MLFSSRAGLHRTCFVTLRYLGAAGFLCSCSLIHAGRDDSKSQASSTQLSANSTNSHGYALLYGLVKDEKDVSKLRFIKRERSELKSLLQEIAQVNHGACSTIEAFAKTNHAMNIKDQGLPSAEVQARQAISKFKENAILHSKDKDLEIQLLLSQNEALTYGSHLAGVIAATEPDPKQKEFLQGLAASLLTLQGKVVGLLRKNYSGQTASAVH